MINLSNRWAVLAVLFIVGMTAPLQAQAVAALAPFLTEKVGLTYTDIGVLTGLFMLPGVFLATFMGPLTTRFGDRLTLAGGLALMGISSAAFALTDSYALMYASRLVAGIGAVAASVLLPKMVADWFHGREIATAMSIIASSVGLGIGLALAVFPFIASLTSWQTSMLTNAGMSAVAVLLLLVLYRDQDQKVGADGSPLLWNINRPETALSVMAGLGRGLFSAGYTVFMSFVPILLIAQGMTAVDAGFTTSLSAATALVSVPLFGYLSDRTAKPNIFIVGGAIGAAASCLLLPYVAPALLWVLLFGALRGGCTGGLMSLPSRVLRPQSRNTGFAVVSAVYFVCVAAAPAIAGLLLDLTGNTAAPLWFAGLLWLLIIALLAAFLTLEKKWLR